jgi:ComF family protein
LAKSNNKSAIICDDCHQRLPHSKNTCFSCGLPLADRSSHKDESASALLIPCGECLKNSPPYDKTLSAFHYETPVNDMITQLKYSAQFQCLPLLCEYLSEKIIQHYQNINLPELILPVPLHPKKRQLRGYNQSQLIASKLSKQLNIKLNHQGILRIKKTNAQSGLDSVERKRNMKNAFQINTELPKHIAIVDDVVTTGTTVSELSKQARQHGATQIDIWCLARAYDL